MKYLAIDLGASSGRGIVGRFNGDKLALEEIHRFSNDPVTTCGTLYWDVLRILYEIKAAIGKCAGSSDRDLASLAIDTWGVDYGLLDAGGRLLGNPIHYRDSRTDGIMERAYGVMPKEEIYSKTGIQFMPFNTLFQLWADKTGDPDKLERAHNMLFMPDLLSYFLTGEKRTEYTIASTGMLLGAGEHDWNWELIDRFGLPRRIFGKIDEPGTPVGSILSEVSAEAGGCAGLKVVHTAAHDTASAVVAVPAHERDFIYISSGTWSLMGAELDGALANGDTFARQFTNEGGAEGKIRFLKNIMGLWLEQESRRQWTREGKKYTYDELSDMAVASAPLRSLINPADPIFIAPGDMPRRIADYCKASGQPVPETPGEVVRCIFDSLALYYRYTADVIDGMRGTRTPYIHIVGGGVKEAPLCRFAASACGRPVYAGPVEATAIGNIAVQAIASGELSGVAQARECVRRSFEVKEYLPTDRDMWESGYEQLLRLIGR
jgi:Sugar (pentulose and hexulose) kinases